jgi:OmcA/MtrC family decaheme c-type cytochrome
VIAGSWGLVSAPQESTFTKYEKAYYADANAINFVRPGLVFTIVSANVAKDGTISVEYKISDPKGQPLDRDGIQTPGAIAVGFAAGYIPKGQSQFSSYNASVNAAGVSHAGGDSGGTTKTVAVGDYIYTFGAKALAIFDAGVSHRIIMYGSRNLTEFDMGTNFADAWFDFVPDGSKVTTARDVVRSEACNKCHDRLALHGGRMQHVEVCVVCHQPQNMDANGNTADLKVFIHKLHLGSSLPSVKAGKPYGLANLDWSTVVLPSDARRCEFCHDSTLKAAQAENWFKNPSRTACGSCHDDVNFATGQNHSGSNLPMVSDKECTTCHSPQGELEYDASIKNAHMVATEAPSRPGLVLDILKIDNGTAGKAPTVTFSVKDFSGKGLSMVDLTGGQNRLALVMAGPTSDYGDTSFGSDVTTKGYVSEDPTSKAQCSPDGTCSYTFVHAIPADATGTYAIGIEGRRGYTILPGTTKETVTEYGGKNVVKYFSIDGSTIQPRRKVVDIAKCNGCHSTLSLHGENRNQIEMCVLCHNPSDTDFARRPTAQAAADKTAPPQAINFALMIHKIHTGEKMQTEFNTQYTIVGFGGSHNDFTDVRFPTMGPTGATKDTAKCYMCHVNNSETLFPIGKNAVTDPQGLLNPAPATTSACTACHQAKSALAHAAAQTDPKFGESCDVCHASAADFDVQKMHAGK